MNNQQQTVLIKNFSKCQWVCQTVEDVLKSQDNYHRPLELVRSEDTEIVGVLKYMAQEMNRSKASEKFWITHAGKQSASGKRTDYAKVLMLLESKSIFDALGNLKREKLNRDHAA